MKRIIWLDLLRIFSMFFVVMIHTVCLNWAVENPSSISWNILNFYDSISRFCVPVFVMISGALFLSKDKIDIEKLYKKNIFRLIVSLVFWAFIYSLIVNYESVRHLSVSGIKAIILNFNSIYHHLRFLLALLGLYIISPVLKIIIKDKKIFKYLLILSIIFSIVIPTFNIFFKYLEMYYNSRFIFQFYFTFTNWLFKIDIPYVGGYLVFFLTGYKLYTEPIKYEKIIYLLGFLSLIFTVVSVAFINIKLNILVESFYNFNTINVYLMSIAIFVFFKRLVSKIKVSTSLERKVELISDCTFGIYLTHEIFIHFMRVFDLYPHNINYLFSVPIVTVIIFVISFMFTYLIKKIPFISKYIT